MTLTFQHKEHETDNVWSFIFEAHPKQTWTAGQFIQVELPHRSPDKEGTKRWFTVSAAPFEDHIQISTRITETTFKQALINLPVGGELKLLEAPDGDFVWDDTDRPMVFVAAGIGITPFRSIIVQRDHDGQPLKLNLVYANRAQDIPFKEELDGIAASNPDLHIHYLTGMVTAGRLKELLPDLDQSLIYLSGPEPLVEALDVTLKEAGISEDQLRGDYFPNYTAANY